MWHDILEANKDTMKKTFRYLICVLICAFMIDTTSAQTQVIQIDEVKPEILGDAVVSDRLEKDWKKRNPKIQTETVVWYELLEGFYGTYTSNNQNYMAIYDLEGNYIQTMIKAKWNNTVPNPLRSSFDLSNYKMQEVTSFWEVSGAGKKSYYIELKDNDGTVSRVWANEKGDFSAIPPLGKSKY